MNQLNQKHQTHRKRRIISILTLLLLALPWLSSSVFAADQVFAPGAYIIDMGRSPQTIANGLKPYGLIYDLVRNALVPIYWSIKPDKLKDGVDFTADGKDYRGGAFIISAEFAPDAIATINTWRTKGVVVDGPIESEFTAPVFERVTGFPNVVIDDQNDGLVTPFYENAEIPSTAYRIGYPYDLGPCDDVFVMPHADPTWEDHENLITFNQGGGFIWAACHAVSALENVDDPADPDSDPDMNFLSEHSLVLWGDHDDGTPPYLYSNSEADHPIMQFMGNVDSATQNGSEQIYLPTAMGWRATTTIAAWDPDHPDIPAESPGEAAVFAYGRGFGNPGNGLVMYEAGHSLDENSSAGVAAQRAYFNFLLLGGIENESQPTINLNVPNPISCEPVDLGATISGGSPPYSSVWSNDCGGSFSDPNDPDATFTPPDVSEETTCIIRQTVIDQCGRFNFSSTTITIENPAVSITKEVTPANVAPGGTVTYTITVTNVGDVEAHLTNIEDIALPAGFSYVPGSTSGLTTADPTISSQTLTWNGDWMVAPAGEATLSYQATAGGVPGTYPSGASTDEACIDTIVSIEDTAIVTVTLDADLSLDLSVDNATPLINDNIIYTITLTNDGPNNAAAVAVTDLLPSGLTYISSTPSQGSYTSATGLWDIGAISNGSSVTLDITARVDSTAGIINTAELTASDQPDPDSTPNNHIPDEDDQAGVLINTIADLAISKTDAPDPVDADSLLTYTLSVTNNGPDDTLNIQVLDVLPVGVTFQSAAGSGWTCTEDSGTVTCTRAILLNGATSPDLTISVTAPAAGGTINNSASTSSAASDTTPANNSIAIATSVNPVADLSITKNDFPDPILKSEPLTYTLNVANNGPSAANSLTVTDTLPAGVIYQSAVGTGWSCSESAGTVTCTRATLAVGATAPDITILVTAPAAAGNISNTAAVTAAETDPDAGNNTTTADTTVTPQADLSGNIYEDLNGDGNPADAVVLPGTTVSLYRDGGDGLADGIDDGFIGSTTTDPGGNYAFLNQVPGTYWVVVDSKTVTPSAGYNLGSDQKDVWAEQSIGPTGALCSDGNLGTNERSSSGPCFGGRRGGQSDDAASLNTAEHVAKVALAGGTSGVDFGFSFNVVTDVRGGDNTDDDGSAARTVQGSLRQLLQNANAITGANTMRFVPAVPANAGAWWQVAVSEDLPDILDNNTTLDGSAYSLSDGTSLRDQNPGFLGSGGLVGIDNLVLPTLNRPEFEILDTDNRNIGLDLQANSTTIRRLAISGFGDAQNNDGEANIRVGAVTGTLIEECVIGTGAASFAAPAEVDTADNIRLVGGDNGTIRNNLIGFSGGNGIGANNNANGWDIETNEIRGNGRQNDEQSGILLDSSANATIRGNLVADNQGAGVDTLDSSGSHTLENNTIKYNGDGAVETPGVRIFGTGSTVDRNRIYSNYGAGVLVTKDAQQNTITRNSIYNNGTGPGGQIGIDLLAGGDQKAGDSPFVTLNDPGDSDSGANGLLNFPILESANVLGGNLVLTGFARPASVIELFIAKIDPSRAGEGQTYLTTVTEGSPADSDGSTGSYGPGPINGINQGSDTTNRFRFEIPVPSGVFIGIYLTATATLGGSTSEFSGNVAVGPLAISGRVYEDVNGDANLADAVGRPSVSVTFYRDGGDGQPDGGDDNLISTVTTDASGNYNSPDLGTELYWVVVDSKTITPSAVFRTGFDLGDVWAEQTYGDNSYSTALDMAARFGGRNGGVSDNAAAAGLAGAQHVARVQMSNADVSGVDFGFSFNMVTNARGGDTSDDDGSADRTIQGSLRQFMTNANAIANANAMRFVPTVPANAGTWWQVAVSLDLPDVLDNSTTIDGTAYSLFNGTSLRNENPGVLGTGGTLGTDSLVLPTLGRPEFEIIDSNNLNIGLDVQAANSTVRRLAIYGFGDAQNNDGEANIRVGAVTGITIEECVIGAAADSFTATGSPDTGDNIRVVGGDIGTIMNNLIGFSGGNGIGCKSDADGWLIAGNEIRGNGLQHAEMNGISLEDCSGVTVRGNLITDSRGAGIDTLSSTGAHTIENNTISTNGTGTVETPGIRLYGTGTSVDRNLIYENYGAGVLVTTAAVQNMITLNSIYDNGTTSGQIGIDLLNGGNQKAGDSPFFTLNDAGDVDSGGNGLLNYPVMETAEISGGNLILTGFARPGSVIELFIADLDPTGFGEGKTYLTTLTEGSGSDLDGTTGSYGPESINWLNQGEDNNTNRFRFEIPAPAGVGDGTYLTATATLGGSTSEFSGRVYVGSFELSGTISEDVNGDADLADAQPRSGVSLRLYQDGGDGQPDGGDDIFVGSITTDAGGSFADRLPAGFMWVVVDSKTLSPSSGFNGGDQADVWPDQTYGVTGAYCADGSGGTVVRSSAGPCFGGRLGDVSDDASALGTAEHVVGVDLSAGDVSGVDLGFSFNLVTNARGGDGADDDGSAARTIQGSLRQFLQNAEVIAGANTMRFVPTTTANASGAGGQWWQVAVSVDLPDILDTDTTLDGRAYSFSDGTTLREDNPGALGNGGSVGVDMLSIATVSRPEFEIVDSNNLNIGLDLRANSATVRHLSISGFGDAQDNNGEANIRVDNVSGVLIEACVIGTSAASFTAPAEVDTADNVRISSGGSGTIRNNLIGFSGGNGIGVKDNSVGWLIEGNEIRGNAHQNAELNGISLEKSSNSTVRGNLIWEIQGAGIDTKDGSGSNLIANNTVRDNGNGAVETPGIRLFGTGNTVDRNVIHDNYGAGVMVTYASLQNVITRNSIYANGSTTGQIGIDLLLGYKPDGMPFVGDDQKIGTPPYVSLNDKDDKDNGGNDLVNYPILDGAVITGGNLILTGFALAGSVIELFIAEPDPSGFGEGKTYLATLVEGSGADLDATTSSYGPEAINGLNQGEDNNINRFRFEISTPGGIGFGTWLTATATVAGQTSEFSGVISLTALSGTVFEEVNGDGSPADAVGRPGVTVSIYQDGGDGQSDGIDDTYLRSTTTDASGFYFLNTPGADTYWVVVDSKTVSPSAGFTAGGEQKDVWAEQTYGDDPTTSAIDLGLRFGGRNPATSDNAAALGTAQHVAKAVLSSADVSGVDFGFSFNLVINTRGGDNTDDDGSADRTVQGSLRQFIQNANAIAGANAMRFVPAVAANVSGGGGAWWQVAVSVDLPDVLDTDTTLDGTAYSVSDGTTVRDDNPDTLGSGGTVGIDGLALPTVERPEFEIVDSNNRNIGLDIQAGTTTVRGLAISGFGDAQNNDGEANIRVGDVTDTIIEDCVIGAGAASFTAPAEVNTADNIRVVGGDNGTIRNNLIGFSGGNGIGTNNNADGWLIEGNEVRGNARQNVEQGGILLDSSASATVRGNLIIESQGAGIDTLDSTGSNTIENNTVTGAGSGAIETPGIRLYGTSTTVDRNLIYENYGAGVLVTTAAVQNTITRNSIYDNGTTSGQIGIDLLNGGNLKAGDSPFITLNDTGDVDTGGNGLLNFPILDTAQTSAGNLILTGFARPNSLIELFIADGDTAGFGEGKTYLTTLTEGSAADLDNTTGSYGPGQINNLLQGSDTTNRFRFEIPLPAGVSKGTLLTATATLGASTSEFSGQVPVDPPTIYGSVFEDLNGDADPADGQPQAGLTVALYRDGGDGNADGVDDGLLVTTTTDGSGDYHFSALGSGTYWIMVDSKQIVPSAGFTASGDQEDVWAEQTYGDDPTTPTLDVAARFGGRNGGVSDNAAALASAEHIARVVLSSADVSGVDFGFSFNVVTNTRGGDDTDDDGSNDRTIQGSLRQYLQNANAINGANAMRFVPAVATNASGGGGSWWQVAVTLDLPDVLDSTTTIDGTAYSAADGTTVRNDNAAGLGSGGTAGVDGLALPTLDPEFEILDSNNRNVGLDLLANNATVRRLAISGFGDAQNNDGEANIRINEVTGTTIEDCVIGAAADSFTATGSSDTGDNIRVVRGDNGTIRNNLIGFSGGNGIGFNNNANGWGIEGNEIRGNGRQNVEQSGILLDTSASATVRGNIIADSQGAGISTLDASGAHTIENNTLTGNGIGTVITPGIRLYGTGSTIDRNVIYENFGAGLMMIKSAIQNSITQNSFYDNGTVGAGSGQIGIDLLVNGDDDKTGDSPFFTLNDPNDADGDANGLLNFPVIETADIDASGLTLTGFARPGSLIEFFISAPDPSGFGEGKTYTVTLTEGSGDDTDATTGHYGPGAVNGIVQGEDTTDRFGFLIPVPAGVTVGTVLTATATLAGSTSEFSGNITVTGILFPDLMVLKSADATNADPGDVITYTVTILNTGNGDATNVVLDDDLSPFTAWSLDAFGAGLAFQFTEGAPASGLTLGTAVYSNTDGADYIYTPVSEGGGAAAGFDGVVTNWKIPMSGTMNAGGQFTLRYKVMVK